MLRMALEASLEKQSPIKALARVTGLAHHELMGDFGVRCFVWLMDHLAVKDK